MSALLSWMTRCPRRILLALALSCAGLLAFGLYLQHTVGLEPCPMCIMQRYTLVGVGVLALIAAATRHAGWRQLWMVLAVLKAGFGAFVAGRQSWLQWNPPPVSTCGRDFYSLVESFPLQQALPLMFKGSGDCTAVDWTFLGGSIANWSFLWFDFFALVLLVMLWGQRRQANK